MQNQRLIKTYHRSSCNKLQNFSTREATLGRLKLFREYFPREFPEVWKALPINVEYQISSWGRIIHLKSYRGKKRELVPTMKMEKYPFITITLNGKRKGISLRKLVKLMFDLPRLIS